MLERQVGFEGMNHAQLTRKHSQLGPELTLQPAQSTPTPFPWITEISPLDERGGLRLAWLHGRHSQHGCRPLLASCSPSAERCRGSVPPWLTRAPILYCNYSTGHLLSSPRCRLIKQ